MMHMRVWGCREKHRCGLDEVNIAIDRFSRDSKWRGLYLIYCEAIATSHGTV
jgi:hypothetical protein